MTESILKREKYEKVAMTMTAFTISSNIKQLNQTWRCKYKVDVIVKAVGLDKMYSREKWKQTIHKQMEEEQECSWTKNT